MARNSGGNKIDPAELPFRELVRLMRVQRDKGKGICVFLGAGCSLSSSESDLSTTAIIRDYLTEVSPGIDFSNTTDEENFRRFINSWLSLGVKDRDSVLARRIPPNLEPSDGYRALARLVSAGYVKAIITTNFDNLIDKALLRSGVDYEFHCGRQPPTNPTGKPPIATLLKIHGGLNQCELAFSPDAVEQLSRVTKKSVQEWSAMPLLVVGYSGQDRGVMTALSTARAHTAFWASPNEPSRSDRARTDRIFTWLDKRVPKGATFLHGSRYGYFDTLLAGLFEELESGGAPPVGPSTFCRTY
ncbi:MAG: SIR2 family protein [Rhizomicrobium sp.]